MKYKFAHKLVTILLIFGIVLNTFLGWVQYVYAEEIYYVVTTDLNFRSKPTTAKNSDGSTNVISEIAEGTYVTLLSTDKISGSGCSAGWYNIKYNGVSGYVCSSYVSDPKNDTYFRPWNTPKKSIVGGAKWISNKYISKGQFTTYLKKFNVNPLAAHDMYSHQYQTNIIAPLSEAKTTYTSYQNNNMLELPFVFNIPVYLNMADNYDLLSGNYAVVNSMDTVVDTAFEATLDQQQFPESYKRILRYLHTIHPTWIFVAMHTGADYTTAAEIEKSVGAIRCAVSSTEICNTLYDPSMTIMEGSSWYMPSTNAIQYYMDPRNFLVDQYIFQFEALNYNEIQTEALVNTILANTFMSGMSTIDNQTYTSMFIEAGKTYDVSPVYLASLSKQEVGVNGNKATTGEPFVKDGITYTGLYNFYSIGASSGVGDGIVYASGSYCTMCVDFVPGAIQVDSGIESAATTIQTIGVKLTNGYIKGFGLGTDVSVYSAINQNVKFNDVGIIKTGMVLTFADGTSYSAVVYGDISGDGVINSADLLRMRQHLLGTKSLSQAYKEAAEVTGDGVINSADLLRMRQYLLGTNIINQA